MKPILIVDDEPAIADLIGMTLRAGGYDCEIANDGLLAADLLEQNDYALALLDIMLPEVDGYDLLEYAQSLNIPVIFITAKGTVKDKVHGLRLGADDYIVKPFEPEEVFARVQSVLRRVGGEHESICIANVILEPTKHTVTQNGKTIQLTPREFDLLHQLMCYPGIVLTREDLYRQVWGPEADYDSRTLDLHINRIRKKFGWQQQIKTHYKIGYILEVDNP